MSKLESEARPYLTSMLNGHHRTYHEGGKALLARWAVKTALVAGSKFKPATPGHFYTDFDASQQPSANTRVWLAASPHRGSTYVDYRPLKVSKIGRAKVHTEKRLRGAGGAWSGRLLRRRLD